MWICVILLVSWPWAWQVADRVWLHRSWIVIGHWAPATRGLTEVLGWYCWWCDWWCLEGWPWGQGWNRWHWEWFQGCRLGLWHQGWWPQLCCWPDWYVRQSLLGCSQKGVIGCKYSSSAWVNLC